MSWPEVTDVDKAILRRMAASWLSMRGDQFRDNHELFDRFMANKDRWAAGCNFECDYYWVCVATAPATDPKDEFTMRNGPRWSMAEFNALKPLYSQLAPNSGT